MILPIHFDKKLHSDKIYKYLTEDSKVSVFLDTNILLWSMNINNEAFKEFFDFLGKLASNNKLVILNWVVFEFEKNIRENNLEFNNFKSVSKRLNNDLGSFHNYLRLVVDDNLATHFSRENKIQLINKFIEAKKEIESLCKISGHKGTINTEARLLVFKQFLKENPSNIPIKSVLEEVNKLWEFRYQNKIPPGFKDNSKDSNKQGDLILWFELIEYCKKNDKSISILITNDNKLDWCSKYDLEKGEKLLDAHPYLKHEFAYEVDNGEFYVINLNYLVDTLFSLDRIDNDFEKYKELSNALGIDLGQSETEKVIEWIIRNKEVYEEVVKEVCYWEL